MEYTWSLCLGSHLIKKKPWVIVCCLFTYSTRCGWLVWVRLRLTPAETSDRWFPSLCSENRCKIYCSCHWAGAFRIASKSLSRRQIHLRCMRGYRPSNSPLPGGFAPKPPYGGYAPQTPLKQGASPPTPP